MTVELGIKLHKMIKQDQIEQQKHTIPQLSTHADLGQSETRAPTHRMMEDLKLIQEEDDEQQ